MILFGCYKCQATFEGDDSLGSTMVTCERCGQSITVPPPVLPRLRELLGARPFRPFRLFLPGGLQYVEVVHPDLVTIDGEKVSIEFSGNAAAKQIGLPAQARPKDPDRCTSGWEMPAFMIPRLVVIE